MHVSLVPDVPLIAAQADRYDMSVPLADTKRNLAEVCERVQGLRIEFTQGSRPVVRYQYGFRYIAYETTHGFVLRISRDEKNFEVLYELPTAARARATAQAVMLGRIQDILYMEALSLPGYITRKPLPWQTLAKDASITFVQTARELRGYR